MASVKKINRRSFISKIKTGIIITIGLPGIFATLSDSEQNLLAASYRTDGKPRLPPGQVAVNRLQDMGGIPSKTNKDNWKLYIYGEVERPITISYKELMNLPQVDIICDVHCVTGWSLLDSKWKGVRLSTILGLAKPTNNAKFIIFEAAGGYTTNVPISDVQNEKNILAHTFFGKELPQNYGGPVRGLIPDRYFYKSAKWLEAIKLSSVDEPGYWEQRGYSNSADPWKEDRYSK